jgi:hypothetical protein
MIIIVEYVDDDDQRYSKIEMLAILRFLYSIKVMPVSIMASDSPKFMVI